MSTSTASFPGYGHAFFDEVLRLCSAAAARLLKLHQKSAGMNSIDPTLLAERIVLD